MSTATYVFLVLLALVIGWRVGLWWARREFYADDIALNEHDKALIRRVTEVIELAFSPNPEEIEAAAAAKDIQICTISTCAYCFYTKRGDA